MIAIYGGSFDPPHLGHLGVIQSFWKEFPSCSHLLIVPNYISPFKKTKGAKEKNILEMLEILISEANISKTLIEEYEIQRQTASYTIDTIEFLREKYKGEEICFLMGIDSLRDFPSWKKYDKILEYAKLVLFDRDWEKEKITPKELKPYWDRLVFMDNIAVHASSSEIRKLPHSKWNSYISEKVLKYIEENELYGFRKRN